MRPQRFHLSIGDRDPSVEPPGGHAGWTVFVHGEHGEPIGDPLYIAGDGDLLDSAAAAAAIADRALRATWWKQAAVLFDEHPPAS